jgi:prevent-host-death family protein
MSVVVNIQEAKTHLSRLVEQAAKGQEFVIAKAGKPMVRVIPIEPPSPKRRLGMMVGKGTMALDVKKDFEVEIDQMFGFKS